MESGLTLLGSSNESAVEVAEGGEAESELELGLGLSLGTGGVGKKAWGECGRILTAKDFPSVAASHGRRGASVGTKRAADSSPHESGSPPATSQVVGWPPIGVHRMNSLVKEGKAPRGEEEEKGKDGLKKKICNEKGHVGFVKVNMDGIPIGRKVDLNAHYTYQTLAQALEDMFFRTSTSTITSINGSTREKEQAKVSKLLDGSSEFVLTYEDKEGDWMLVGDVPWGMFLSSVRRLRIMRTSEANGLAPRFQERNERQRSKLV